MAWRPSILSRRELIECEKQSTTKLDEFLKTVQNEIAALTTATNNNKNPATLTASKTMKKSSNDNNEVVGLKNKRNAIILDDLLTKFASADLDQTSSNDLSSINKDANENEDSNENLLQNGDDWYRNFRTAECKNNQCCSRQHENDDNDDEKPLKKKSFLNIKPNLEPNNNNKLINIHLKEYQDEINDGPNNEFNTFDISNNIKNIGNVKQDANNLLNLKRDPHSQSISVPISNDDISLDDQTEQNKNDLSHEANYKLSKIEQDAGDRLQFNNISTIIWPISKLNNEHNQELQQQQQPQKQNEEITPFGTQSRYFDNFVLDETLGNQIDQKEVKTPEESLVQTQADTDNRQQEQPFAKMFKEAAETSNFVNDNNNNINHNIAQPAAAIQSNNFNLDTNINNNNLNILASNEDMETLKYNNENSNNNIQEIKQKSKRSVTSKRQTQEDFENTNSHDDSRNNYYKFGRKLMSIDDDYDFINSLVNATNARSYLRQNAIKSNNNQIQPDFNNNNDQIQPNFNINNDRIKPDSNNNQIQTNSNNNQIQPNFKYNEIQPNTNNNEIQPNFNNNEIQPDLNNNQIQANSNNEIQPNSNNNQIHPNYNNQIQPNFHNQIQPDFSNNQIQANSNNEIQPNSNNNQIQPNFNTNTNNMHSNNFNYKNPYEYQLNPIPMLDTSNSNSNTGSRITANIDSSNNDNTNKLRKSNSKYYNDNNHKLENFDHVFDVAKFDNLIQSNSSIPIYLENYSFDNLQNKHFGPVTHSKNTKTISETANKEELVLNLNTETEPSKFKPQKSNHKDRKTPARHHDNNKSSRHSNCVADNYKSIASGSTRESDNNKNMKIMSRRSIAEEPKKSILKVKEGPTNNEKDYRVNVDINLNFDKNAKNNPDLSSKTKKLTNKRKTWKSNELEALDINKREVDKEGTEHDTDLKDVLSGKLPAELAEAVFTHVQKQPLFQRYFGPGLTRSYKYQPDSSQLSSLHSKNTRENPDKIDLSNKVLRDVMDNINKLIQKRVHNSECIELTPDLQAFYNQIVESNQQRNTKFKRDGQSKIHDFHDITNLNNPLNMMNPSSYHPGTVNIRKKCSVVKKLLNEYDYLQLDDQLKARPVKDMLNTELEHLQKLGDKENLIKARKKRQILKEQQNLIKTNSNMKPTLDGNNKLMTCDIKDRDKRDFTPNFMKLIKTVADIKANSISEYNLS